MSKSLSRLTGAAAIAVAVMAFGATANAAGVKVGVLTCHESSGWGFIFGSSKDLRCTYRHGPYTEHYNGAVNKFGVDVGYTNGGVIIWDVFAPNYGRERGALNGDYVGGQASLAVGPGAGANALVGGFERSFTLQPVSIEGETGLNVAAGIGSMSLHFAGDTDRDHMDRDRDHTDRDGDHRDGDHMDNDRPPPPPPG